VSKEIGGNRVHSIIPYASVVDSQMYVMVYTQPDISHVMGVLSRYMLTLGKDHWIVVKRVFMYLCGTKFYVIWYQGKYGYDSEVNVHGFFDIDSVGDMDRRRSTSGYVFKMFDGAISWMSKRQVVIVLSTTEYEYMEATHGSKEAVWLQRLCSRIRFEKKNMKISCDSQSAIFL
jgi:hypothetical protein